jgi:uncharacterized integral membrane protein
MSASSQIPDQSVPESDQAAPKPERRPKREQSRTAALVILASLITLFAVLNTEEVKVWIFGSRHAPLIIVIVVSLLVGVALGHFAERRSRKRR